MGRTKSAAMMLCIALKQTFSRATAHSGTGHITRSSISRVMPNSLDSGSATPAMPENMMATAINPGKRMVPKFAEPPPTIGMPLLMRGRMKVKTKRNRSGCIPTRSIKGNNSRVITRRSRRNSPPNALKKMPASRVIDSGAPEIRRSTYLVSASVSWRNACRSSFRNLAMFWRRLFTQVPPGETDEDGLQAGFSNLKVAQSVAGCLLHQFRQQAVGAGCNHAQSVGGNLSAVHTEARPDPGCQWLQAFL